ncbi:MAG TPA: hypothetical protein GXX57_04255 [Firmicutes bacterium]|nr:hypothetical protein [Bacillota bacterium]
MSSLTQRDIASLNGIFLSTPSLMNTENIHNSNPEDPRDRRGKQLSGGTIPY